MERYLDMVLDTILLRDIVQRHGIRNELASEEKRDASGLSVC